MKSSLCIVDDADANADEPTYMYYVNDGIYGSFNIICYEHPTVKASLLDVSVLLLYLHVFQIMSIIVKGPRRRTPAAAIHTIHGASTTDYS